MFEQPATQILVHLIHDELRQIAQSFNALTKRWPMVAHDPIKDALLGATTLVTICLCVIRMSRRGGAKNLGGGEWLIGCGDGVVENGVVENGVVENGVVENGRA